MKPIYLDYAATTPVDDRVAKKMMACLTQYGVFGNPASGTHEYGEQAKQLVDTARAQVAATINAEPREIVWTSGATESDNLAIKGIADFHGHRGKHIITAKTEHKAVLDTCKALEKDGFNVTYLAPQKNGEIALSDIETAITPETILISIMLVNNETGYIQSIAEIGALAKQHNIYFHVDGAQAIGKMLVDVNAMNIDLLSMSAHKVYGPKGIGALYFRRKPRVKIAEQIHGGGHENGMRSGTLPTHQIIAMGEAFEIAKNELEKDSTHIKKLRTQLLEGLQQLPGIQINTDLNSSVENVLNVSFSGVDGDALLSAMPSIAVSTGSACNSVSIEPSYVLQAMGISNELAHSTIRYSLGRFTTEAEVETAIAITLKAVNRLRELSPVANNV